MELLLSDSALNAQIRHLGKLIDTGGEAGTIKLFARDRVLLVTLKFSYPAFSDPVDGLIEAKPITPERAVSSGRAIVGRISNSKGVVVFDCDVAKQGGVINLSSVDIQAGGLVQINSFTLSQQRKHVGR